MEIESKTYPDMCVCCGAPVPEGRMVCRTCEKGCIHSRGAKPDKQVLNINAENKKDA